MKELSDLNPRNYKLDDNTKKNLELLFDRLMDFQEAYGKTIKITSGLRSQELQQQLIEQGKTTAKLSHHMMGLAADVFDPRGEVKDFILSNVKILESIGLWCEDFGHTPEWVHFQVKPPKSGKRFFIP